MYSNKPAIIVPKCGADTLAIRKRIFELHTEGRENSLPALHMIEELDKIYDLKIKSQKTLPRYTMLGMYIPKQTSILNIFH
jgi:hypothetical protein